MTITINTRAWTFHVNGECLSEKHERDRVQDAVIEVVGWRDLWPPILTLSGDDAWAFLSALRNGHE